MRGISAALKPTLTAGIFVEYALTSHEYVVFVYNTGATIKHARIYFNSDVFPDDSGGAVVSTEKISMRPANTGSPARRQDNESPASTEPATRKVTASGPVPSAMTQVDGHDTQI